MNLAIYGKTKKVLYAHCYTFPHIVDSIMNTYMLLKKNKFHLRKNQKIKNVQRRILTFL